MIRIGETHTVMRGEWPEVELDASTDEAVKRLVGTIKRARRNMTGHYVSAEDLMLLDAALAPFTDTDASLVDSGLRSCATPENEETGQ